MSWLFLLAGNRRLNDTNRELEAGSEVQGSNREPEVNGGEINMIAQQDKQESNHQQNITVENKAVEGAEEARRDSMLQEAIDLHNAGVAGDKQAVVKAYELLKTLYQQHPDNPFVAGYYGSILTLSGRDAVNPAERLQKALAGLKILDEVVKNAPDNIQVRTLRANICYRLPEMYFHRMATAMEDFRYLAARYEEDNSVFAAELYDQIVANLNQNNNNNTGQAQESQANPVKEEDIVPGEKKATPATRQQQPVDGNSPAPRKSIAAVLKEGCALHAQALEGNKKDRMRAHDYFAEVYQMNPTHQLITAYYADCLTLMGFYAKDLHELFASTIKATKLMDNAVYIDPDNVQVRLLRAYQGLRLPEAVFHRTTTAIEDLKYLLQCYEEDNSIFTPETYQQMLFDLAIAYRRLEMEAEAQATLAQLPASDRDKFIQYGGVWYSFNRL